MITGFSGCTVWSEDLNRLLPFYRDTLGLPVRFDTPEFVMFGAPNVPALALGTHSEVKGNNADSARLMIGVATDDVEAEYKRLKSAGVDFVDGPTNFGQVIIATCKDPDGNLVQVIQFLDS